MTGGAHSFLRDLPARSVTVQENPLSHNNTLTNYQEAPGVNLKPKTQIQIVVSQNQHEYKTSLSICGCTEENTVQALESHGI